MKIKSTVPVSIFILLAITSFTTADYTGENLLLALGADVNSKEFKAIKDFWLLGKNSENIYGGIKLSVNSTAGKVQSILIAGENFQLNGTKFFKCSSPLPFAITLTDDVATLRKKLGEPESTSNKNTLKFYSGEIAIEITYSNSAKIYSVKFYRRVKPVPVAPVQAANTITKTLTAKATPIQPVKKTITPPEDKTAEVSASPFKKALLNVFASYKESNFYSIKSSERSTRNFWNYQYTYATKLKIPGEKFNMLYSFPFVHSPLDFVSVIKEADGYDASFATIYKDFEKKLMQDFPASEGWAASCIPNKESKTLSDLEFTNDRYGSIVLDYSKNPKGKHILYLRFLLYSS